MVRGVNLFPMDKGEKFPKEKKRKRLPGRATRCVVGKGE